MKEERNLTAGDAEDDRETDEKNKTDLIHRRAQMNADD
jgi:hypothetical protein